MENKRTIEEIRVETAPGELGAGYGGPAAFRSDRILVGTGDENVAKIQLAARWAEAFAAETDDSLESMLHRFYRAYSYIDSVTHSVAPEEP